MSKLGKKTQNLWTVRRFSSESAADMWEYSRLDHSELLCPWRYNKYMGHFLTVYRSLRWTLAKLISNKEKNNLIFKWEYKYYHYRESFHLGKETHKYCCDCKIHHRKECTYYFSLDSMLYSEVYLWNTSLGPNLDHCNLGLNRLIGSIRTVDHKGIVGSFFCISHPEEKYRGNIQGNTKYILNHNK